MGRFYNSRSNRVYADYKDIAPCLIDALIATEDLLLTGYSCPKKEVITLYLNWFDFLNNAKGTRSAANIYFSKEAKDLELHEAAVLVGMLKNPAYYNPVIHPDNALERRNFVFDQMVKAKKITRAEADSLKKLSLGINFNSIDHRTGIAPYFREELRRILTAKFPVRSNYHAWEQQKFVDDSIAWANNPLFGWIEKNPKPDGSKYNLYTDGLRIYTTIDSRM
ncbi:MAG: hypothetical protein HDS61_02935, partial [Barnesiella sp.]|nr:hypothetical protein [Barnesiella sp.]